MLTIPEVLSRYEVPVGFEKFARRFTTVEGLWRYCERADWMLWLFEILSPCDAERLREFTCHCARRWWHHLEDPRLRRAVEAAEAVAAGVWPKTGLDPIRSDARQAMIELQSTDEPNKRQAALLAMQTLNDNALDAAKTASRTSSLAEHSVNGTNSYEHEMEILLQQADDLRRTIGNPFPKPTPQLKQSQSPGKVRM
ncbi:MAG: hypothetical protein ACR2IE_13325 [Candidatus Sumerlaeaceae bacterium]